MRIQGVEIPDILTKAIEDDQLVIFAGAGVSMQPPSPLPDFTELVGSLARLANPGEEPPFRHDNERLESFLGRLGEADQLKTTCADIMRGGGHSALHEHILSLFDGGVPRIVTTNYDLRFEQAASTLGLSLRTFSTPALPLGNDIRGIVHLHGDVSHPDEMILVDADYGSAYVSDGWVARFLVRMFERYTVLFVGYSLSDMPVQYLVRSVSAKLQNRVFVLEIDPRSFDKWQRRGITPISFLRYEQLPELFREWRCRVLRTVTERAQAVARIAATRQVLTDYEVETLRKAFEAPDKKQQRVYAQAFAEAATSFESLEMLVAQGYESFLFSDSGAPRDEVLRCWVARSFATAHYRRLVLLAEEAHRPFSGPLQALVMQELATRAPDDECLAFWAAFLDARAMGAAGLVANTLGRVIERCAHHEVALAYIRKAFSLHASLARNQEGDIPTDPVARFDIDLSQGAEELQRAISLHADALSMQLFLLGVNCLNEMESIRTSRWLHETPDGSRAADQQDSSAERQLVELCVSLGQRLARDPLTRNAAIEACRTTRAAVVREIGRQLG